MSTSAIGFCGNIYWGSCLQCTCRWSQAQAANWALRDTPACCPPPLWHTALENHFRLNCQRFQHLHPYGRGSSYFLSAFAGLQFPTHTFSQYFTTAGRREHFLLPSCNFNLESLAEVISWYFGSLSSIGMGNGHDEGPSCSQQLKWLRWSWSQHGAQGKEPFWADTTSCPQMISSRW